MRKTLSALTLSLGVAGCDSAGPTAVFSVAPIVTDGGPSVCPVITGITTGSLEALLGGEIELEAFASSSQRDVSFRWSGGRFEPPDAAATRFVCMVPGDSTLSVALGNRECPDVVQRIGVTCSSERCTECLRAASALELVTHCIGGDYFNRADTERCIGALTCSLADADHCATDEAGPVACYCGDSSRDDCARSADAGRSGPRGSCVAEWEAAAGCKPGDARCVLGRLLDLGRPSGVAYSAARHLAGDCSEACRPSL